MSTQPTDAEILELASQYWYSLDETESETEIELVRAALAKWGPPAQAVVGGKPVYQARYKGGFWQDSSRERHEYLKTPEGSLATDWELRVLYTAPQPVEREPLTNAQREKIIEAVDWYNFPQDVIDAVERAHGIKGGQHVE